MSPAAKIALALAAMAWGAVVGPASAQDEAVDLRPYTFIPESSIQRPEDLGLRAHTYIRQRVIPGIAAPNSIGVIPNAPGQETPASLACVYRLVPQAGGCDPRIVTTLAHGGSRAIGIVDAYDNPTAAADLAKFGRLYHLPAARFAKVYAAGHKPRFDSGWQIEAALDVQWTHGLAPHARIFLVEAATNSFADLLVAEKLAAALVAGAGGGEVSNSWGGGEFIAESRLDSGFVRSGVVFFASSGDSSGTQYPSASPNVVAVGGTTIARDLLTNLLLGQAAWDQAGGGVSRFEDRPAYQGSIASIVGTRRGVPDIAAVANPESGVLIIVDGKISALWGGTGLASPLVAAIVNAAGKFRLSTATELATVYANRADPSAYHDIAQGACGPKGSYHAAAGWDKCTGVGTPNGLGGK